MHFYLFLSPSHLRVIFFFNNYVFCFLSIIIYLFIIIMYLQFHALILICLPLRDCIHISWHQNNLSKLLTFSFTLTFLFIKLIFSKLIYILLSLSSFSTHFYVCRVFRSEALFETDQIFKVKVDWWKCVMDPGFTKYHVIRFHASSDLS